jgi:succinyl-CoA synthetase beta subunit
MNIHEYQAKALLRKYGVAVPKGGVAYTPDEAADVATSLSGPVYVVKAQIHAGGRGKAGGVKVVKSIEDVRARAEDMLGKVLVTHQTGPEGREVKRVYVEDGCNIARELYAGMLIDRATSRVTLMVSTEGGMEIEEIAQTHPEKIVKIAIDPVTGLQGYHAREAAFALGLKGAQVGAAGKFLTAMYNCFMELDASIVEINPLVVTGAGEIMALDAKMSCATRRRKTRSSWKPASTPSTTSSWMATSAAWSTARAWPWRPWTSSSCMAANPPTSWMSGAGRRANASPPRSS